MREFTIPAPLKVKLGAYKQDGEPLTREMTWALFLTDYVFTDSKQWGESIDDTRRAIKILNQLEGKNAGEKIRLEDADASRFNAIGKKPTAGWNQYLAMQAITHIEALLDYDKEINPHGSVVVPLDPPKAAPDAPPAAPAVAAVAAV